MRARLCTAVMILVIAIGWKAPGEEASETLFPAAPPAYEMSAWELLPELRRPEPAWTTNAVAAEILRRIAFEKRRHELDVYYYRIGYTLAFPMELERRPTATELPVPITSLSYPWLIWMAWEREDRWRLLHAAWRRWNDQEAGARLQQEMAALAGWDRFGEANGSIGLLTAHTAASLAAVLANTNGWNPGPLAKVQAAAGALIERDVWPWFNSEWRPQELTPRKLGNIPVIALARAAQLARVIQSPRRHALEERTLEVLRAWCRFRSGPEHHTEGANYDGYLFEALTDWLRELPNRDQMVRESREGLQSLADTWVALTLPGRLDLHAPLSDDEPEMTFWATALQRVASWTQSPEAAWVARRFPLTRLRAAALIEALDLEASLPAGSAAPSAGPRELPYAVSLRNGWNSDDLLAALSLTRSPMNHLQADGGQLVLAWQGRCWIADPGYQQYRGGEERDYTLGTNAHNAPVIGGMTPAERLTQLDKLETTAGGCQHARLDLTRNYRGLAPTATVRRDVWFHPQRGPAVVVRDSFQSLSNQVEITHNWQGGHHFAWAFREGWARLSDGQRALWIGTFPGTIAPAELNRHPGTRGPLTLTHRTRLPTGAGERWWLFVCDPAAGWQPPAIALDHNTLKLQTPGADPWCVQ